MSHRRLLAALCQLIGSAEEIVCSLTPEVYSRTPAPLGTGSVGAHLRHCLDTCRALVEGVPGGVIDYSRRERELAVEEDPSRGLEVCVSMRASLMELVALDPEMSLSVVPEKMAGGVEPTPLKSNLARELESLRSHTLHHFAMVAVFLRHQEVDPGPEFGVAPSTLEHWEEVERCAPLPG